MVSLRLIPDTENGAVVGVIAILQTITEITLPVGCFELLRGDWPKPIEQRYTAAAPKLSTVRCAPSYRMEAKWQLVGNTRSPSEDALNRGLNLSSPNINFPMNRAADEVAAPAFGSEIMLESLGSALLVECGGQPFHRMCRRRNRV